MLNEKKMAFFLEGGLDDAVAATPRIRIKHVTVTVAAEAGAFVAVLRFMCTS